MVSDFESQELPPEGDQFHTQAVFISEEWVNSPGGQRAGVDPVVFARNVHGMEILPEQEELFREIVQTSSGLYNLFSLDGDFDEGVDKLFD